MPEQNDNTKLTNEVPKREYYKSLSLTARLVLRLLADKRVNFFLKLLPLGTLVYMLVPEPIPFVDDVIIIGLGTYVFIELCPPDVVEEHRANLSGKPAASASTADQVIDSEFKDRE